MADGAGVAGGETSGSASLSSGAKRKAEEPPVAEDSDLLTITPLGAGQEVGRSCHILKYKGKTIMLDCGIHPGKSAGTSLPFTDSVDASSIDIILVTHFHLDHCGALPWFMEKTTFKGRVFMTHATKAIYRFLLADYVKVSNTHSDRVLYDERDLENTMVKIEAIDFHQETNVQGVRFCAYQAGHVLGAAMFFIEIAGVKILYTGDYSREEDRHLMAAEIPPIAPDILIAESTYGVHVHEPRDLRETRFTRTVRDIVTRGGRCLIPVFALGRAQELLLILDEYWQNHSDLHEIPIFYASALAARCMKVYETYVNTMNQRIKNQMKISNPFKFKHISNMKNARDFNDSGPSVVMASPGMLQNGLSRELCESWAPDAKNGVVIAGYCVEGTLAKDIMKEPQEIPSLTGQKIPRKMSISYVSFSAHVDYEQNSHFIRTLNPPHLVLVHGEKNEMERFKTALLREYENDNDKNVVVYTPANTKTVELHFRGEKMAKVVGQVAHDTPTAGQVVSGLLIKRGFTYNLVDASDLQQYTDLKTSVLHQKQVIQYGLTMDLLKHFVLRMFGESTVETGEDGTLMVMEKVKVTHSVEDKHVTLEWEATPENDMWADALLAVILQIESSPESLKLTSLENETQTERQPRDALAKQLKAQFGNCELIEDGRIRIVSDGAEAIVSGTDEDVICEDAILKQSISSSLQRLSQATEPFKRQTLSDQPSITEVKEEETEVESKPGADEEGEIEEGESKPEESAVPQVKIEPEEI